MTEKTLDEKMSERDFSDDAPNAKYYIFGFGFVILVLFAFGMGWLLLTSQSESFDRFSAAGDVENLMYDARLHELIYTRDESEEAAENSQRVTQDIIARTRELQKIVQDEIRKERLSNIIDAVHNYQILFKQFVRLKKDSK